jgi:hypothetical protein
MAQRVIVKLMAGADVEKALEELRSAGAANVIPPRPEDPQVAIAEVPEDEVDPAIERFNGLDVVENAERDVMRWSM